MNLDITEIGMLLLLVVVFVIAIGAMWRER